MAKMVGFGAFDSEKLVSFFQDNFKQKQNESRFCCFLWKIYKFNHLFDIHFTLREVGVNQD